jgi:sulfur-carrier protein
VKVQVRLFAVARQAAGRDAVEIDVADGATVAELRKQLIDQVPSLARLLPHMTFAVGSQYVSEDSPIPAGTDVACIPPVSGG